MEQRSGLSDLWRTEGTIDRGPYAALGVGLFVVKLILDTLVARLAFGRPWSVLNYLESPIGALSQAASRQDVVFVVGMLGLALPFIYLGIVLTVRRLRAAELPLGLAALFFVPLVNLLFFAVLSVLPSRAGEGKPGAPPPPALERLVPHSKTGAAAMALLIVVVLGTALTALSVYVLREYGWSLFVGLPFVQGLVAALLYGYHEPRSFKACLGVALSSLLMAGAALMVLAMEGAFCVVMAFPIAALIAALGALVGYLIQRRPGVKSEVRSLLMVLLPLMPLLMGAEHAAGPEPPLIAVRTSVDVAAPPELVWRNVVTFSDLPEPHEWMFRIGIAYPIRARIEGEGVGAVRYCEFSTGPFVEPIEVWDEPRLLKFAVTAQPRSMDEWSLYPHVDAPHVDDFLASEGGQFLLTALPGGGTRLEGTTWYRHRIWPVVYWRLWSDWIIHRIHGRVLEHIRTLSEAEAGRA
jgi:uncharacterized membrane protein YhaH (DUF805 family)